MSKPPTAPPREEDTESPVRGPESSRPAPPRPPQMSKPPMMSQPSLREEGTRVGFGKKVYLHSGPCDRFKDKPYVNWVVSGLGLQYTKESLEGIIETTSQEFYNVIKQDIQAAAACGQCDLSVTKSETPNCVSNCPRNVCGPFKQMLESQTTSRIDWKCAPYRNITSPATLVALYLPSFMAQSYTSPAEANMSAFLNLLEWCLPFKNKIADMQLVNKVRESHNAIIHSGTMRMDTAELNEHLSNYIALLEDKQILQGDNKCKQAIDKIKKIRDADVEMKQLTEIEQEGFDKVEQKYNLDIDERRQKLESNDCATDEAKTLKEAAKQLTEMYRRVNENVLPAPISSSSAPVPESQQNLQLENFEFKEHDGTTYSDGEVKSISAMAERDKVGDEKEIPPMTVVIAKDNISDNADSRLSVYTGEVIYLLEQDREYGEWKAETHDQHGLINISSVSKFDLNSLREAPKIVTADLLPYCLSGTFSVFLEAGEANFTYNNHGDIVKEKLDISGLGSDDEILDQLQKFIWKNRAIFLFYIDDKNAIFCNQFLNSNRHITKHVKHYPYIPDWYHGYVEKEHAGAILGGMPTGTFLVIKDIPRQTFVLSVTDATSLHHFQIEEKDGQVACSKITGKFDSVTDLVEQCFATPLFLDTGNEIRLVRYISRYNKEVPDGFSTLDPYWTELYLQTLSEGSEKQKSVRLMIVGHEKVGKTTLSRNLMDISREGIVSTDGIEVHIDTCEIEDDGTWKRSVRSNVDSGMIERIVNIMQSKNKPDPGSKLSTYAQKNENVDCAKESMHISDSSQTGNTQDNVVIKIPADTNLDTSKDVVPDIVDARLTAEHSHQKVVETTRHDGIVVPIENASKIIALSKSVDESADKTVSIWDFGGQYIYYATHQLFHSPRAVYLLVLDLAKPMDEQVDYGNPVGASDDQRDVQTFIKFWMHSIHTFVGSNSGEPPVILVGTHKDKIEKLGKSSDEYSDEYFENVRKLFDGTPLLKHIQPKQFFIDNLTTDSPALDELKATIMDIAGRQSFRNQEYPARWVKLEYALKDVRKPHLKFSQVCEIDSRNEVPIVKIDEIRLFLMFHHFQGNLVYFNEKELNEFVILNPQWLIDAFKSIITSGKFCKRFRLRRLWQDFGKTGILNKKLIKEAWEHNEDHEFFSDRDMILKFFVRLGIISRCRSYDGCGDDNADDDNDGCGGGDGDGDGNDGDDLYNYIVPSLLPVLQTEHTIKNLIENTKRTDLVLVFRFESSYISPTIYHRTTAAAMGRWAVVEYCDTRILYGNIGMYTLDVDHVGLTRLTDRTIELSVYNLNGNSVKGQVADCFRRFITKVIKHELNRFQSENISQFETVFRCACTSEDRFKYMTSQELKSLGRKRCLQSSPIHHIDGRNTLRQWYPDNVTRSKGNDGNVVDKPLDDRDIGELAKAVGKNWTILGASLGLSRSELDRIEMDRPSSALMQIWDMFKEWKKKVGSSATMKTLVDRMKANESFVTIDWDIVQDVLDRCESDDQTLN